MDETKKLAQFIANTRYNDLSDEVIEKTKLLILDQIGCQLAFANLPWNKAIHNYVKDRGSSRQESTVTFYGFKTSAEDAAFANAVFGHGFEMDDTELTTASHPGVAIIPPALAVCESQHMSGKELITAIVAVYDVFIRVGLATHSMMKRGGSHYFRPGSSRSCCCCVQASEV
jgi:2-methylcitrate dehydratase PrpD